MRTSAMRGIVVCALFVAIGCDLPDRVTRLEKDNQQLRAQLNERSAAVNLELQAKCSRDATAWVRENYQPEKNTVLLDHTIHYNKAMNKCFALIEHHYRLGSGESWMNDMTIYDVYENSRYGHLGVHHTVWLDPSSKYQSTADVLACELLGSKCKTAQEFNSLLQPYMNN